MRSVKFASIQSGFFFGLVIALGIISLLLFLPFFYAIFWAGIIAIMLYPFYAWLNKHLNHEVISAIISVILSIIVLVIPLVLVISLLAFETANLVGNILSSGYVEKINEFSNQLNSPILEPIIDPIVERIRTDWSTEIATFAKNISSSLFDAITAFTQNLGWFLFLFFIMLYTLYYFFKDGKRMLERLMYLSPLGDSYEKMLFNRFTSTTRATLKSNLIIGLVQATLGWILFATTGVSGAFVWAVIMLVVSIIPAIGSVLVWGPIGFIMIFTGNIWQGIVILLIGGLLISTIDNFLRPYLVGKDIQMHPLFVLFSTLGGIIIFGPSGFIIGPILMALFLAVINMYSHYYKRELSRN